VDELPDVTAPAAAKTLRKLPRNERERILAAIERLPAGRVPASPKCGAFNPVLSVD
jgi:hypothetical protein